MAKYSHEFKMDEVKSYLTSEISYQKVANHYRLNNPSLIARWVLNYKKHGRPLTMPKYVPKGKLFRQLCHGKLFHDFKARN